MRKLGGHNMRLLALLAALSLGVLIGCSKGEENPQPVVTVQTAPAERGSIQQIITADAILFPRDQAAITPKVVAPVKQFYVNRGSRVHRGQLLAVLENRDLAAAEVENKGAYEQAAGHLRTGNKVGAAGGVAEGRARSEDREGSLRRRAEGLRRPAGSVPAGRAAAQGTGRLGGFAGPSQGANTKWLQKHLQALESAGRQRPDEISEGTAYLGARQVRGCRSAARVHGNSQPHRRRGHRPSLLCRGDTGCQVRLC